MWKSGEECGVWAERVCKNLQFSRDSSVRLARLLRVLISGCRSAMLYATFALQTLNDIWGKSWNGQHLLLKKFA